jgi:hypothetical protein
MFNAITGSLKGIFCNAFNTLKLLKRECIYSHLLNFNIFPEKA